MHTYARACFTCLSVMSIQTCPCHWETGGEAEAGFQFVHLPPSPLHLSTPSKEKTTKNPFASKAQFCSQASYLFRFGSEGKSTGAEGKDASLWIGPCGCLRQWTGVRGGGSRLGPIPSPSSPLASPCQRLSVLSTFNIKTSAP